MMMLVAIAQSTPTGVQVTIRTQELGEATAGEFGVLATVRDAANEALRTVESGARAQADAPPENR